MCLHVKSPWRDKSYFSQSTSGLSLFGSTENWKKKLHFEKKVRDVKWSIQPLSVCHCQPGHQRVSPWEEGGLWHKEVEVFLVSHLPEERASCQKTAWTQRQERRHSVGVNDAFFITLCSGGPVKLCRWNMALQQSEDVFGSSCSRHATVIWYH